MGRSKAAGWLLLGAGLLTGLITDAFLLVSIRPVGVAVGAIATLVAGWGVALVIPFKYRKIAIGYMAFCSVAIPLLALFMIRALTHAGL
jgi:hypothetical protein